MRLVAVVAFVAGCNAGGAPAPAAREAPAAAPLSQKRVHDCRDLCEQNAILERRADDWLRQCRAGCDARAVPAAHETPRSITVAPAETRLRSLDGRSRTLR